MISKRIRSEQTGNKNMKAEEFFNIFLDELKQNDKLKGYYRFLNDPKLFEFRKAYFLQRLKYIERQISDTSKKVFDIGCGYGTTGIFLALNGFEVYGNTLEFYYDQIQNRLIFWNQYGSTESFTFSYENLFDSPPPEKSVDYIIVQDVLHHLEPLDTAINIIYTTLKPGGKLIACEENGLNLMNRTRLFMKRGNKRIIKIYDDKLEKEILLGNENIRSLTQWEKELSKYNLEIDKKETEYIRYFFPGKYKSKNMQDIRQSEQHIWKKSKIKRDYFFHGINFTAVRKKQ